MKIGDKVHIDCKRCDQICNFDAVNIGKTYFVYMDKKGTDLDKISRIASVCKLTHPLSIKNYIDDHIGYPKTTWCSVHTTGRMTALDDEKLFEMEDE